MTFLTFLYIFNFNLFKNTAITGSTYLAAILLFMNYCRNSRYRRMAKRIIRGRFNHMVFWYMVILILMAIIWPVIHSTFDFSFASVLLHQYIVLEIGLLLVAMFKYKHIGIIETVINSFFMQSIIQISCFFSPELTQILDVFRSDGLIEKRALDYDGFRGLAVSGSNFFGLAVAYGIIFIVLFFYWEKWNKRLMVKLIYVVCMAFGALSAGRTSILGLALFAAGMIVKLCRSILKIRVLGNVIVSLYIIILILVLFGNTVGGYFAGNTSWQSMSRYLFQFMGDGRTESGLSNISSLQTMFGMYFELNGLQLLFGRGMYSDPKGGYFMHTDVGYMRNPLFWGIFCTGLLYLYEYKFLITNAVKRRQKEFAIVVYIALAVFEIKGQTLGLLIISQCMLLLVVHDLNALNCRETNIGGRQYAAN